MSEAWQVAQTLGWLDQGLKLWQGRDVTNIALDMMVAKETQAGMWLKAQGHISRLQSRK